MSITFFFFFSFVIDYTLVREGYIVKFVIFLASQPYYLIKDDLTIKQIKGTKVS